MALTPTPPSALGSSHPLPHKLTSTVLLVFPARLGTLPGSRHSGANGFLQQLQQVTATNAAFVNRILQRDTVVQHDGPSIAKVPPYPRFYNYDPKQNRRSIIHRNPYIPREKAS